MARKPNLIVSPQRLFVSLLPLHLLLFTHLVRASCFYPDGSPSPNDLPCRDDTPNSTCCGQGYACLSNSICEATGDELMKPNASKFVRGSCTDKSWRSSACPLFCNDPSNDNVGGGEGIQKCDNTTEDIYFCINQFNIVNLQAKNCDTLENVLFFPGEHKLSLFDLTAYERHVLTRHRKSQRHNHDRGATINSFSHDIDDIVH